jgi:hypothetical protein
MSHSFPPMDALKFRTSLIFMPLFCGLKNHDIIGSALTGGRLLIVNLIEQGYTLVAGTSIIF